MSAEVIAFPTEPPNSGNGAREALMDVVAKLVEGDSAPEALADWLLAELWQLGFKVAPLDPTDG